MALSRLLNEILSRVGFGAVFGKDKTAFVPKRPRIVRMLDPQKGMIILVDRGRYPGPVIRRLTAERGISPKSVKRAKRQKKSITYTDDWSGSTTTWPR